MAIIEVLNNKYAKLVYHTDEKIVHHVFHKDLNTEHLQLVLNTGVELLREHRACKWIADTRAIGPFSDEDGRWINDEWLPRALKVGWKYWALVVPEAVKARMMLFEHMSFFDGKGIRINVFTDFDAGWTWLNHIDRA